MKMILALLMVAGISNAQSDVAATSALQLNCVVPMENAAPVIKVVIEATEETQGDFLTVTINEPTKELVYFNQLEKGAVRAGLSQGQLVTLVIAEGVTMENGAIRGAGFIVIAKSAEGLSGFLSLNNSFYPVQCN
ncbi:MAG: hypothetical protein ACK5W9_07800 [Bdellovibrionales bacterium]